MTLNRAVAEAMAGTPIDGLRLLTGLGSDPAMRRQHRFFAVHAHLREMAGSVVDAEADYRIAAGLTTSTPEQRYLHTRGDALGSAMTSVGPTDGCAHSTI